MFGTFDDFGTAVHVVEDGKALAPDAHQSMWLEAKVLSAIHRFEDAQTLLERARAAGAQTDELRQSVQLAAGPPSEALMNELQRATESGPSFQQLSLLAAGLKANRKFTQADQAYASALKAYKDVSPFPVAWIWFQRGVMWGEHADDIERAKSCYQEALARLPTYVTANVHLAEIEFEDGLEDAAIRRLEELIGNTQDPEPASRLATFYERRSPEKSAAYQKMALKGYEQYLQRYPLAFADHATEFFLGPGQDPLRALELAQLNLGNRKTPRAYKLAMDAARAAGQSKLLCKLAMESQTETDECAPTPSSN